MIKRQYNRFNPSYFYNFVNKQPDMEENIRDGLAPYRATIAKSKNKNSKMNIKWHDPKLYALFVLRHS